MTRVARYVDTAIMAYAVGGEHPLREPCQRWVLAAGSGDVELHASVEMIQEFLFHRMRRTDRETAFAQARNASELCVLHAFDVHVLSRSMELIAASETLGGRDAVHAATALVHGLRTIVSPDTAFDGIDGLHRLAPTDDVSEHVTGTPTGRGSSSTRDDQ
ncbi:MAG: type II toxin-antitoxin system VapC family toxin [Nocardioidaceae bacterium]